MKEAMMARKLESLDQMLAKRSEAIGSEDCFPWEASEDLTLQIKDPAVADIDWKDDLAILRQQLQNGEILPSQFQDEMLEMYLGEDHTGVAGQIDAFLGAGGTSTILGKVVEAWTDPTRTSSRSTRRQSRQR